MCIIDCDVYIYKSFYRPMNPSAKAELTDEEVWYIIINQETRGPISLRDLDVMIRTSEITSQTYAWRKGMDSWRVINDIQEIKQNILESTKQIYEIEKKRDELFEKPKEEEEPKKTTEDQKEEDENAEIENKDENPLEILETTVDNLLKKIFQQTEDGKWNVFHEEKQEWVIHEEEPTEKMQKMKNQLLAQLKNQLFFDKSTDDRRKKPKPAEPQQKEKEDLTPQQLLKREKNRKKTKRAAEKKKAKWYQAKMNTYVYISGLPFDITEQELKNFVAKAGVLRIDHTTGQEKLRLYRDDDGIPKGDAVVSYAREESVDLALDILNENEIKSGFPVKVVKAQFNQKDEDYKPRELKKQTKVQKIQAKKLQQQLYSWDEELEGKGQGLKIVIIKHVFPQPGEDKDKGKAEGEDNGKDNGDDNGEDNDIDIETQIQEIKDEITEGVQNIGDIKRIRFYEHHPDGIVQIKFQSEKDAESCIQVMNERYYDGRKLQCEFWDGVTDFNKDAAVILRQNQRLEQFANELEKVEEVDENNESNLPSDNPQLSNQEGTSVPKTANGDNGLDQRHLQGQPSLNGPEVRGSNEVPK